MARTRHAGPISLDICTSVACDCAACGFGYGECHYSSTAKADDWHGAEGFEYDRVTAHEWSKATPEYREGLEQRFWGWEKREDGSGGFEYRRKRWK